MNNEFHYAALHDSAWKGISYIFCLLKSLPLLMDDCIGRQIKRLDPLCEKIGLIVLLSSQYPLKQSFLCFLHLNVILRKLFRRNSCPRCPKVYQGLQARYKSSNSNRSSSRTGPPSASPNVCESNSGLLKARQKSWRTQQRQQARQTSKLVRWKLWVFQWLMKGNSTVCYRCMYNQRIQDLPRC